MPTIDTHPAPTWMPPADTLAVRRRAEAIDDFAWALYCCPGMARHMDRGRWDLTCATPRWTDAVASRPLGSCGHVVVTVAGESRRWAVELFDRGGTSRFRRGELVADAVAEAFGVAVSTAMDLGRLN